MELYNSLTRTKEEFIPRNAGKVSMYTCGPTVYHFAHIGNLRSYIMEDILEKYLRYAEKRVKTYKKRFRRLKMVQKIKSWFKKFKTTKQGK